MSTFSVEQLTPTIGAEVSGVDLDTLLNDEDIPGRIWTALREHGVLLFRGLGFDAESQVKFGWRLGRVNLRSGKEYNEPGIMRVSLDPAKNGGQETMQGTFNWHMDGCLSPTRTPSPATILTCVQTAESGGQTGFTSTRAFFASLDADEQERLSRLRVVHSIAGTRRRVFENPTPEQEAQWATAPRQEHPLVWRHREGRPSLVIGGTADYLVGMDHDASSALLDSLVQRAAAPGRVYRHEWSIGDTVIWDNHGLLHYVEPYEGTKREMIRTTLVGTEPTDPGQ